MADAGTPDWWLDRLYTRLRKRRTDITTWDDWYSGDHPAPRGHEKAGLLLQRLLETTGLNVLAIVTDAALDRMHIEGFKVGGKASDDIWEIWQSNNFDLGSTQVMQEKMALSAAYVMVDPNENRYGLPTMTAEHPEQAITEDIPGSQERVGLKVYVDDTQDTPLRYAYLVGRDDMLGDEGVRVYAAPTRTNAGWALRPQWEYQESLSGANPLDACPLVPFHNRPRLLRDPYPEWWPALSTQKRINKTLLDRMAMQDEGAFKAMWATGIQIPVDPATKQPVEPFKRAIDRMFVNENPEGKFGQFEAEDIKQLLEAVRDDIADAAITVPTSPDQILAKLVNVSGDGLKLAQVSEVKRVRRHMKVDEEGFEEVARLGLRAAGKETPDAASMSTVWRNPEFRTESEMSDAATKALANGMPLEAVWERYYGATPDEIEKWKQQRQAEALDPVTQAIVDGVNRDDASNVGA